VKVHLFELQRVLGRRTLEAFGHRFAVRCGNITGGIGCRLREVEVAVGTGIFLSSGISKLLLKLLHTKR
jgi:hypothetical protein